jgi:DNA-binding NarL/FixJ family response regulator
MNCETGVVLDVLEAAYRLEQGLEPWLEGIASRLDTALGDGSGTLAMTIDLSGEKHARFENVAAIGVGPWWREQIAMFEKMPIATLRAFSAGPVFFWSHVARSVIEHHPTAAALLEQAGRQSYGVGELEALAQARAGGQLGMMIERLVFSATNPHGPGIGAIVPRRTLAERRPSAAELEIWGRVATHLGAAFRLRGGAGITEARLAADGKVLDATGRARSELAREALRTAAVAQDRVRSRRGRRASADDATAQWRAVVAGRWSLVDQFERDGRRYLVAKVNEPPANVVGKLTAREAQVADLVARGHANKLIAYDLGISRTTVVRCIGAAMQKLRLSSRIELIRAYRQRRA